MPDIRDAIHAHDDELELYICGRLEPELISAIEPHLWECQACRAKLSRCVGLQLMLHPIGETKAREDYKRSEPRFSSGDDAVLQELNPLSLDRHRVKIVDISKNGVGILAPKSLRPGTIVQIRIKSSIELGEVRHCSAAGHQGYRIGLRLHVF